MELFVSTLTLSAVAYESYHVRSALSFYSKGESGDNKKVILLISFVSTATFGAHIFALLGYHLNKFTMACEIAPRFQNEFIV